MMVSAHVSEPVDYLDINSVVLLFVVLCYTLLPSFVYPSMVSTLELQ